MSSGSDRIQKILAQMGLCSRRQAEDLIREGAITINGKVAKLGDKATLGEDSIKLNGKLLTKSQSAAPIYLAFNKPKGVIAMFGGDPEHRPTLDGYFTKIRQRIFPIGRMDFNGDGLILLTNDGEISEKIQKAKNIVRVYHAKIKGHHGEETLRAIYRGARIDRRAIKPYGVKIHKKLPNKTIIEVVFQGSGSLEVKELFRLKRLLLEKVTRVAMGQIKLGALKPGEYRLLKKSQLEALLERPELGLREHEQGIKTPPQPIVRLSTSPRNSTSG